MPAIEDRLTALEDRLAIIDLIAGSPFSSDSSFPSYQEAMYGPDAILDRDTDLPLYEGRAEIVGIIEGEKHLKAIADGMAHMISLPFVKLEGNRAVATCYIQVLVRNKSGEEESLADYPPSPGLRIWRMTANRFDLKRQAGGWQVVKRTIRPVPGASTRELLRQSLAD